MTTLNFNIGVLGHVDSGKTSLSKVLSTQASTACFDKNPQVRLAYKKEIYHDLPAKIILFSNQYICLGYSRKKEVLQLT